MQFDPHNTIVKLCSEGMNLEGQGKKDEALKIFMQAWDEAKDNLEKFISAHYVAKHQQNPSEKLKWDETALGFALKISDQNVKGALPSLYLNIAKGYEDLQDIENAGKNYQLALSYTEFLEEDGYGKMIRAGISEGLKRVHLRKE